MQFRHSRRRQPLDQAALRDVEQRLHNGEFVPITVSGAVVDGLSA
jgi:hypothetical protein